MVGFGVAVYTGIIERGMEHPQGAKSTTTNQNDTNLLTEDQLETAAGTAAIIRRAATRLSDVCDDGTAFKSGLSIAKFPGGESNPWLRQSQVEMAGNSLNV